MALTNINSPEEVMAYEPDQSLRDLIGHDVKIEEIFSPVIVAECRKILDNAHIVFFEQASKDLAQLEMLIEHQASGFMSYETAFEQMAIHAGNLRGLAEMFGYRLIASISGHIASCCESTDRTAETRMRLAGGLIRMLSIATREKVKDEAGNVSQGLKEALGNY